MVGFREPSLRRPGVTARITLRVAGLILRTLRPRAHLPTDEALWLLATGKGMFYLSTELVPTYIASHHNCIVEEHLQRFPRPSSQDTENDKDVAECYFGGMI